MEAQEKQNQNNEKQEAKTQEAGSKKKFNLDFTDNMPKRSLILWCLAGAYLLYTGYRLCSNVIKGVDGGNIGFFLAGIVFLVIGGGLLFFGVRGYVRLNKQSQEEEAAQLAEAEADAPEEITAAEEETPALAEESAEPNRRMSIAQRAALVNRIDEEERAEDAE